MSAQASLRGRARRYVGDAAGGIRRAPVEVLATLCVAVAFSWAVEQDGEAFRSWAELAVACLLLLAVAWTGTLLRAMGVWQEWRRWIFTIGGALVVMIYALAFADFTWAAEAWRAGLLVVAAVLWLFALPAFGGPSADRVDRMRRVDGRILLRMIGALLYTGALYAGLALALQAVDSLFELDLEDEIYGHVFGWIFFVLAPWIVLGGLPDYVRPAEEPNAVASVAQRIALYLVPPLLALYYVILYAYVVRIIVTAEIPKNLVSPLVLAAGALAALGVLLFDPRPGGSGLARWLRLAPPLFLPLGVLGGWALLLRVEQYGLTEFRLVRLVVLVAMCAAAVAGSVQLARRRRFLLHLVPAGLAAVLLIVAIGPWSAMALSRRSQETRLAQALHDVGIPPADTGYVDTGPDSTTRVVPAADYEQISGSARYLARHFGPDALPPVMRVLASGDEVRWIDYAQALRLRPDQVPGDERFAMGGSLPFNVPLAVAGRTAYRVTSDRAQRGGRLAPLPPGSAGAGAGGVIASLADSMLIAVRIDGRLLHADLAPLVASLSRQIREPSLPADRVVVPLTDTAGAARGQFLVWNLHMETDSAGTRIAHVEGLAVLPEE